VESYVILVVIAVCAGRLLRFGMFELSRCVNIVLVVAKRLLKISSIGSLSVVLWLMVVMCEFWSGFVVFCYGILVVRRCVLFVSVFVFVEVSLVVYLEIVVLAGCGCACLSVLRLIVLVSARMFVVVRSGELCHVNVVAKTSSGSVI